MKSSSWALCAAAVLAGDMGLQLLLTQPMAERVDTLSIQVSQLQTGIDQLTGSASNAAQTNDLLSNLTTQGKRTESARAAIEQIRRFEREVRSQGNAVGHSMNLVQNIGRLHNEIIAQGQTIKDLNGAIEELSAFQQQVHGLTSAASREYVHVDRAMQLVKELGQLKQDVAEQAKGIDGAIGTLEQLAMLKQRATAEAAGIEQANQSLNQLGDLKERVAVEAAGLDIAETQFARLIGLKKSLELMTEQDFAAAAANIAGFTQLRDLIVEGSAGLETAIGYSRQMLTLQGELVEHGGQIDVAQKHADGLLSLEESLSNDADLNMARAQDNLNSLVAIEQQLNSQDEQIVAAVESLELMSDLQGEFTRRLGDLESLRTGLAELAMLESSIVRTVRALQPLVELTSLRRLDGDDLQAIAREMMDRRTSRIAASDPSDLPVGGEFGPQNGDGAIGAEEMLVPIPPTRQ